MLHCPNENEPWHSPQDQTRFLAEAVVRVGHDWLIEEYVEFLPTPANCGECMAEAYDDGEY